MIKKIPQSIISSILVSIYMSVSSYVSASEETAHNLEQKELLIFAASSLSVVLPNIVELFEEDYGIHVRVSFASSAALARQIDRGAPADIFISANTLWIDHINNRLIEPQIFAGNEIVLSTRIENSLPINDLNDLPLLPNNQNIAIGDPTLSPLGRYTREALEVIGIWSSVEHRLIFGSNARATALFLEQRAVDYAFLYASDVKNNSKLHSVLKLETVEPVTYIIASLDTSRNEMSASFRVFLESEAVKSILIAKGLKPAE